MLRRIILALIGLLAVVNGSKWLFDGKRLPTLALGVSGSSCYKILKTTEKSSKIQSMQMKISSECKTIVYYRIKTSIS